MSPVGQTGSGGGACGLGEMPLSPAAKLRTKEGNPFQHTEGGRPAGGRTAASVEGWDMRSSELHAKL